MPGGTQISDQKITKTKANHSKTKRNTSFEQGDIDKLNEAYGPLTSGMTLTLELSKACALLGRTRRRIDAFKKLQDILKADYGVELIITSRKTHHHGTNK